MGESFFLRPRAVSSRRQTVFPLKDSIGLLFMSPAMWMYNSCVDLPRVADHTCDLSRTGRFRSLFKHEITTLLDRCYVFMYRAQEIHANSHHPFELYPINHQPRYKTANNPCASYH